MVAENEQVFSIEKADGVEDVSSYSAFQIRAMLSQADPGQIRRAADDYRATAGRFDELAAMISRDAGYLAESWRAPSAAGAQAQLRQHYASLRSVAAAARAAADAWDHAAETLARAKWEATFINGGDPADVDQKSPSARPWQALLAQVNAGYREAIQLAPNHIAYNLPATVESPFDGPAKAWKGSTTAYPAGGDGLRAAGASAGGAHWRPPRVPPAVPANPPGPGEGPAGGGSGDPSGAGSAGSGSAVPRSAGPGSGPLSTSGGAGSALAGGAGGVSGGRWGGGRSPSGAGESLVSGGYRAAPGGNAASLPAGLEGPGPEGLPGSPASGGAEGDRLLAPPSQLGGHEGERERARRYFLPEERDIWGAGEGAPDTLLKGAVPEPADDEAEGDGW